MQKVHRSILVNPDQTEPLETRDRVNTGGGTTQEKLESPDGTPIRQLWPSILLNGAELAIQSFHKLSRETDGTKHLPRQLRRPRGIRAAHDVWGAGVC